MSIEEPTFDLDILLEPDYKEIINSNRRLFEKEYEELRKNYEKYKTLDVRGISPEDMVQITLNYIYYKSYKIIDYYVNDNLDHFIEFEDDFKFKIDLYEPKYAEAHRLFILYLDSVELLFQLILAHTVVNNIYKLEKSIIKKNNPNYNPKNMFDSLYVGLKYKNLVQDWCKRNNYKLLNVCKKSHYPSKIRQLKLFYNDKVIEIRRINDMYYEVFNILYLYTQHKDKLCNIYNIFGKIPTKLTDYEKIGFLANNLSIIVEFNSCESTTNDYENIKYYDRNKKLLYCFKYSKNLKQYVKNCVENEKFIILTIHIYIESNNPSHANMLIYNPNTKEIEIFEPYGTSNIDKILTNIVIELFPKGLRYIPQSSFTYLFQKEDLESFSKEFGHCITWTVWYTDQKLKNYPKLNAVEAYNRIYLDLYNKSKDDFQKTMRDYTEFIKTQRQYVLDNIEEYTIIKDILKDYWRVYEPIEPTPEVFKSRISLGSSRLRAKENLLKTKKEISELEKKMIELQKARELERKGKVKKIIEQKRAEKRRKSAEEANPFKPPRIKPLPIAKPPRGKPPPPLTKR